MLRNRVLLVVGLICALLMPNATAYATDTDFLAAQAATTHWKRLAASTALGTMMQVVDEGFAKDSCDTVVIATDGGYWDALTATGLAGKYNCPVLQTNCFVLSQETRYEIARLGAKKAVIIGGPRAVGTAVETELRNIIPTVQRVYGNEAVDTALAVYREGAAISRWGNVAIIVTDGGYWDALSISPYSFAKNAPIFLASQPVGNSRKLNQETLSAIRSGGFDRVYICGGSVAISTEVESQLSGIKTLRLAGPTAVDTSQAVANQCLNEGMNPDKICFATDGGYWDGLSGGAVCGKNGAPLLLTYPDQLAQSSRAFLASHKDSIQNGYILGGEIAVKPAVMSAAQSATR